jgi:hypothetical protein
MRTIRNEAVLSAETASATGIRQKTENNMIKEAPKRGIVFPPGTEVRIFEFGSRNAEFGIIQYLILEIGFWILDLKQSFAPLNLFLKMTESR